MTGDINHSRIQRTFLLLSGLLKILLKTTRVVILLPTASLLLSACVSTEPLTTAPHINLSPETVFVDRQSNDERMLDFGLEVSANESDSLENLEILPGVRVRRVDTGSPATAAGIKAGDIILAINSMTINHPDTLATLLQNAETGQNLQVKARRDTTVYETTMVGQTLVRANIEEHYRSDPLMSRAGYRTDVVKADNKQLTVARIVEIFPKSPFSESNIAAGDAIVAVDDRPVESAQALVNAFISLGYGEKVTVTVLDQQSKLSEKTVRLWDPGRRLNRLSLWPLFNYESDLSPSSTRFSLLDFWVFSIFEYQRENTEKSYRLFTLFRFGSGAGELLDDSKSEQ